LVRQLLTDFIGDPERNNLGPGAAGPAWEDFLLGFSRGDDPLWDELKHHAGPLHWTPAEAFTAARGSGDTMTNGSAGAAARRRNPPGNAGVPIRSPRSDAAAAQVAGDRTQGPLAASEAGAPVDGSRLTVISWALCQTEATKAANRRETQMPSEPWARARIYGQQANRALHLTLMNQLRARGHEAVAPSLLPAWGEVAPHSNGWASTWSERHVAYVSGLGTFGLCGGLITAKGKAVRLGSVVVQASIPPTPRPYGTPFAYCLELSGGVCAACTERCPAGSVSVDGRDKEACARHLDRTEQYVRRHYGFEGYGCGLCQTGVPCESGLPGRSPFDCS
jgi:hypothetical protein